MSCNPLRRHHRVRGCAALLGLGLWALGAHAALPAEVEAALQRARVPSDALAVVVQEAGSTRSLLAQQDKTLLNPASLAKLLTTQAALELLGPGWTWNTPVWLLGSVDQGVLDGPLVIKGSGDPKLVLERVWLLLRRVQLLGVREIRGDIVLDRSAFAAPPGAAADFDGDATRPYNVQPDALLLNFKAVSYGFVPEPERGVARVLADPPLAATQVQSTVRLGSGPCEDWRSALKADFSDARRVRFNGVYPAACGEMVWPVADAEPASYNARLIEALWRDMGGKLAGRVVDGNAPAGVKPSFELKSPPLADVVRDINKYSNNVMAQQLFLTLALQRQPLQPATPDAARAALHEWLAARVGELAAGLQLDNGSGLSRDTRVSAALLARALQLGWSSAVMPELISSLPVNGVDGTLRRSRATPGRAHLKTGSLRDVAGIAGYVLSDSGRRYVLVALINHPNANAARAALDALVQWALRDGTPR
ncbi:MAG TPA: D-alanyl-D-alanine carboxypeptidase/D-alanyl-D-alanine-endopeptidase [Rubrivivax sp.]|nr:D-alanyl-D-alanine carboxypeptidase/D-alanyl-D-alanine-endopeptidase [Rubrivivax sp.]